MTAPRPPLTAFPWVWRNFGDKLRLVTDGGGFMVVLSARGPRSVIETRDPKTGAMRALRPDDPVACAIAANFALVEAIELIQGFNWRLDDSEHGEEIKRRALAALAAAKGGV